MRVTHPNLGNSSKKTPGSSPQSIPSGPLDRRLAVEYRMGAKPGSAAKIGVEAFQRHDLVPFHFRNIAFGGDTAHVYASKPPVSGAGLALWLYNSFLKVAISSFDSFEKSLP